MARAPVSVFLGTQAWGYSSREGCQRVKRYVSPDMRRLDKTGPGTHLTAHIDGFHGAKWTFRSKRSILYHSPNHVESKIHNKNKFKILSLHAEYRGKLAMFARLAVFARQAPTGGRRGEEVSRHEAHGRRLARMGHRGQQRVTARNSVQRATARNSA